MKFKAGKSGSSPRKPAKTSIRPNRDSNSEPRRWKASVLATRQRSGSVSMITQFILSFFCDEGTTWKWNATVLKQAFEVPELREMSCGCTTSVVNR